MRSLDIIRLALGALRSHRARTGLMLLAMSIGVAAVIVLTALGEGARHYVTEEFASLGTNLIIVIPGRSETTGAGAHMVVGETPRDLTLGDARSLTRSANVRRIAPVNIGLAPVAWRGLEREVPVMGSTADLLELRRWTMAQGHFLPAIDLEQAQPVVVLGSKVRDELFRGQSALGEWVRIGDRRFRVIGILASTGHSIGVNVEDVVMIPVASAQALFNTESLFRIMVEAGSRESIPRTIDFIINTLKSRHQGEEDVTVITQDAVLATFDRILRVLTAAVAGIAAISLAVAGILIMNVMLVSVTQRTREVGLLKAIGATERNIVALFLTEAGLLSLLGAALGLALGGAGAWLLAQAYPVLDAGSPWWAIGAAGGVALLTGLIFGVAPARRAAQLDPVQSLARR